MNDVLEQKSVLLGSEKYEYIKTNDGAEQLIKSEDIGKRKINIVIKNTTQTNTEELEKYIIDVLSDLYIQKNIKRIIKKFTKNSIWCRI